MIRVLPESQQLPRALYRAEQVRRLDRIAIEQHGIPAEQLMERAGAAAFSLLRARWPQARSLVVLAGAGNNGGDGYVIARLAHHSQLGVRVLTLGDHSRLQGAALSAAQAYQAAGGSIEPFTRLPPDAELIVDAMLGTGLERPLTGLWAAAVAQCQASRAPILALDIPSGLHADSGRVLGAAIKAAATISFIGLKCGLFTGLGPEYCGEVCFDALRVPALIYASEIPAARRIDWSQQGRLLPRRRRCANKGDFGYLLVVGGDQGMSGAARLAGEAALRAGVGRVAIATHPVHAALLNLTRPELMVHAVAEAAELDALLERATLVALGPGLGQGSWGRTLYRQVLAANKPLVLDADGLNLLAQDPQRRSDWVLTPHPGEAARLLGCSVAEVETDRFAALKHLQERYGGVVVLKGAGTLVDGPGLRPVAVCMDGNPGMASAGMGDALTGIIAALIGQGMEPVAAAEAGVCLHGAAGDRAAEQGERGLIVSDLIAALQPLLGLADEAV
ncbi:NAD(P)H-hydrate dehydratase [Lamprobacter modestohalophilus]|uniref:NAD(P)H-hydrate dehydratase n=1 Tax=Lamprobacter modestohalophilus TaxID=1064514 RepID=UPI002ADEF4BD|nr:NAD(P)H-hydrate dehydratase [Lamprobacter modestohalophilus]MEA1049765.1 NAD(P)H-hydrate dehydratase [Lamprobacter modestohalophilus]